MRSGLGSCTFPTITIDGRVSVRQGCTPGKYTRHHIGLELFNLESDLGEATNVAVENPEVVARLSALAGSMHAQLGDILTGTNGSAICELGRIATDL